VPKAVPPKVTGSVRLQLLGPFAVVVDGRPLSETEIGSRKGRTVLKLLLLGRGHVVSSDRIAEVLWGEDAPAKWERDLATLVSRLRSVLGTEAVSGGPGGYRFVPSPRFEIDLAEADRLVREAESRLGAGEPSLARAAADRALRLLGRGTLLEDEPYAEWAEAPRAEAAALLRRARRCAGQAASAVSDFEPAARVMEAAVSDDPLDEEAHRELMLAYSRRGELGRALETYERLRGVLAEELGTDPAPETRAVHLAILRQEAAPSGARAEPPGPVPQPVLDPAFVGREPELAWLTKGWTHAVAGRPSMVVISGEAGIGKTTLAGEVVRLAGATGGTVALARCYEAERSLFLQPVVDAVRSVILSIPPDSVRELAGDWAGTLGELIPEVGRILRPIRYERATPDIERTRTFEAVTSFFRALADQQPVALFLDDLQNAGSSTIELLHFLLRRAPGARLLVVATIRAEEGEEALVHLGPVSRRLELGPLPGAAVLELARRSGAADQGERILAMTQGHPLFVVEILRAIAEGEGSAAEAAGGEALLPDSLRDAVLARVRRVGPEVEGLLRAAATLGSAFGPAVLAQLLDLPPEETARRAETAHRARLLVEAGAEFEFANDLVREILYRTTPLPTRTARHRRAAELLAANPEAVAAHAEAAGDWPMAMEAWLRAGERAASRYANRDAEQMLDRALHAATVARDPEGQGRARLFRSHAREAQADYPGAYEDLWAAIERARAAGSRTVEMRALRGLGGDVMVGLGRPTAECLPYVEAALSIAEELRDVPAQVDALARMAVLWSNRLRFDLAFEHARRAEALARGTADDGVLASALDGMKTAAAYSGDLTALERVLPELQGILRRRGDLWGLQWALFEASFPPTARGEWDRAIHRVNEAVEVNRRIGYRAYEPGFVAHLAWIHRSRGDYGRALELGRQAVDQAGEVGHPWWTAVACSFLASLLIELRDPGRASEYVERGLGAAERDGAESYLLRCLGIASLAAWLEGHSERAAGLLERAEDIMARVRTPTGTTFLLSADAYVAVATVRFELGDVEAAERVATGLLQEARAAGWKEATSRAAVLAGRCRAGLGDDEGAGVLFREALELAEQTTLPATAWQARAGLAGLAARRGPAGDRAEHVSAARAIVEKLALSIGDEDVELRRRYVEGASRELEVLSGGTAGRFRARPRPARSTARPAPPAGRLPQTGDR